MTNENLLPFDPNRVPDLIKSGKMRVVDTPTLPRPTPSRERPMSADPMAEQAKNLLGRDFLGPEAILAMQQKLNAIGVDVEFPLDVIPNIPYTQKDLEFARDNQEMLVLRIPQMVIGGEVKSVTIMDFRELFRQDPTGGTNNLFYSFNPSANDWYKNETFATQQEIGTVRWALVKKDVLNGSKGKKWSDQETLLKKHSEELKKKGLSNTFVARRNATEAVWDEMLYYVNTGERLLPGVYDWTSSQASDGGRVSVGGFDSRGLGVDRWLPGDSRPSLGVCSSR